MDSWQNNHLVFFTSPHHAVTILITRVKRRLRKLEVSKHFSFIDETTKKSAKSKSKQTFMIYSSSLILCLHLCLKGYYESKKQKKLILKLPQTKIHDLNLVDKWQRKIVFHPNGFVCIFCSPKNHRKNVLKDNIFAGCCCDLLWVVFLLLYLSIAL